MQVERPRTAEDYEFIKTSIRLLVRTDRKITINDYDQNMNDLKTIMAHPLACASFLRLYG